MQKLNDYTFICVQPYDFYFYWQVEVLINNFRKHDISDLMHVLIWFPEEKKGETANWEKLKRKYPEVNFFYYIDSGNTNISLYIPQLRADALYQHFEKYPELSKKTIFYHDCDIIFNYLPGFADLAKGDVNWQSNTSGYLDYEYLRKKEEAGNIPEHEVIDKMASIGGITTDVIKSYIGRTGGAQYVLKDIDTEFWKDVKETMINLRKLLYFGQKESVNKTYFSNENAGFQSWCADMWAVNFCLWKRGKVTDTTPKLDFSWATDDDKTYMLKPIYHNAGVSNLNKSGLFYKGEWMSSSPIGKKHKVRKDSASYFYVKAMDEVK